MARTKNKLKTRPVKASSNPVIVAYLNDLVLKGRYGKTPTEVAERLIANAITEMVRNKEIEDKTYSPEMDQLKI
jgi:pyruvate/oxaloacetate carboxyltransferase